MIVTVLLPSMVVNVVVMLVKVFPVRVMAVILAGIVGPGVTVAFSGVLGPPEGKIVNVLLPTTVVIAVEMLVKMFPVGAIVVVFNGVIVARGTLELGVYVTL